MPKIKTRKAAAKRFKVTKGGKIMRYKSNRKHLLEHKPRTMKRKLKGMVEVAKADRNKIRRMLAGISA